MNSPLLSVITVVYNNVNHIKNTINSVLLQKYKNIEIIVIDGGSTDGTIELLKQFESKVTLISEQDSGIYDAMNKGIFLATGEWIIFMNSGDSFYSGNSVIDFFAHYLYFKEAMIAYGDVNIVSVNRENIISQRTRKIKFESICHQGQVISRKALLDSNGYNTIYKVYSDFDFQFRCFLQSPEKIVYVPVCLSNFNLGGVSSRPFYLFLNEYVDIIKFLPFSKRLPYLLYAYQFALRSFIYEKFKSSN